MPSQQSMSFSSISYSLHALERGMRQHVSSQEGVSSNTGRYAHSAPAQPQRGVRACRAPARSQPFKAKRMSASAQKGAPTWHQLSRREVREHIALPLKVASRHEEAAQGAAARGVPLRCERADEPLPLYRLLPQHVLACKSPVPCQQSDSAANGASQKLQHAV